MSHFGDRIRLLIRAILRIPAGLVRRALTPATPPVNFTWHQIVGGPAVGTEVLLPQGGSIVGPITSGTYEDQIMPIVQALVAADEVCFDIGGHYGYYTLSLAKLASNGSVHTFEPVSVHATRIRQAAERSGLTHVRVNQVAVAGEVGEMNLRFAEAEGTDDSMAYLESYGGVDSPAAEEHYRNFSETVVKTVTLDSLATEKLLPGFIKIDAEGAEASILAAGKRMIAAAQPRILIEIHGIYEALGCANLLSTMGYRAILLSDQKTTLPILLIPQNDEQTLEIVTKTLGRKPTVLFDPTSTQS